MIVLDARVLIAHLDARDRHHARATDLLLSVADEVLGASVLTLAEVLVGPARRGRLGEARTALRELGVEEIELGSDAPARLVGLRAGSGLKLPDRCVLLAAADAGAEALGSFDEDLRVQARGEGLGVRG